MYRFLLPALLATLCSAADLTGNWVVAQPNNNDDFVRKTYFDLKQDGDWTSVLFKHQGWKEPVEFMHHCSTKWGTFLVSLKSLLETGKGAPYPNDLKIDSWE